MVLFCLGAYTLDDLELEDGERISKDNLCLYSMS